MLRRWSARFGMVLATVVLYSFYVAQSAGALTADQIARCGGDTAKMCLPSYRWNQVMTLESDAKWTQIPAMLSTSAAMMVFLFSSWIWGVTTWLVNQASSFDILSGGSGSKALVELNNVYQSVASAIVGSNLLTATVAGGFLAVMFRWVKGGLIGSFKEMLQVLWPIAVLVLMFGAASQGTYGSTGNNAQVDSPWVGSPVWIAENVRAQITDLGGQLSASLGNGQTGAGDLNASCDKYIDALNKQYIAMTSQAKKMNVVVSNLWKTGYLDLWGQAATGNASTATLSECHLADYYAHIDPDAQSFYTRKSVGLGPWNASAASNVAMPNVFPTETQKNHYRPALYTFMACVLHDGGSVTVATDPSWQYVHHGSQGVNDSTCQAAYGIGTTADAVQGKQGDEFNFQDKDAETTGTNADKTVNFDVRNIIDTAHGTAFGGNMILALFAFVLSIIFLLCIGGLSIGTILAQLGVVVLLALSPLWLLMMAIPSPKMRSSAKKMFKMILGMLASQAVFVFALSLLILVTAVLTTVLHGAFVAGSNGMADRFTAAITSGMAPIVALLMVRWILKQFGLDITSVKGAVKTMAGVGAAGAAGGGMGMLSRQAHREMYRMQAQARNRIMGRGMGRRRGRSQALPAGAGAGVGAAGALGAGRKSGATGRAAGAGGGNRTGRAWGHVGGTVAGAFAGAAVGALPGMLVGGLLGSKVGKRLGSRIGMIGTGARLKASQAAQQFRSWTRKPNHSALGQRLLNVVGGTGATANMIGSIRGAARSITGVAARVRTSTAGTYIARGARVLAAKKHLIGGAVLGAGAVAVAPAAISGAAATMLGVGVAHVASRRFKQDANAVPVTAGGPTSTASAPAPVPSGLTPPSGTSPTYGPPAPSTPTPAPTYGPPAPSTPPPAPTYGPPAPSGTGSSAPAPATPYPQINRPHGPGGSKNNPTPPGSSAPAPATPYPQINRPHGPGGSKNNPTQPPAPTGSSF